MLGGGNMLLDIISDIIGYSIISDTWSRIYNRKDDESAKKGTFFLSVRAIYGNISGLYKYWTYGNWEVCDQTLVRGSIVIHICSIDSEMRLPTSQEYKFDVNADTYIVRCASNGSILEIAVSRRQWASFYQKLGFATTVNEPF